MPINCNYTLAVSDCFLQITNDAGKLIYQFKLENLIWIDKGNDSLLLDDCCTNFTVDIDCIDAYATVADLVAFLTAERAACMATAAVTLDIGGDCTNPLHVEKCTFDNALQWCELLEVCNVTEAGLTNGNTVLYDAISLDIDGLHNPYQIFGTDPGRAAEEAARLQADLIALGYGATVRAADPPTDSTIDLTITGLTSAVIAVTWVDFDNLNDTILASINCTGTGVSEQVVTFYVWLLTDGTQRWVNASDLSDVYDTFPPSITGGKLCDPVADNLKSINKALTAPCGSDDVPNINVCNIVLKSECYEDAVDGCDYTIDSLPVNGNTFTNIMINGAPYVPTANVNFDGTDDWGKMDALEAELAGLGYTIISGTRIGTDPTVLTSIEGWGIYSTTDVFNQVTYKSPAPAVPFVEAHCGINKYIANYLADGSVHVFDTVDPATNLGAINPLWVQVSCDPGLKAISDKLDAECSDAQKVEVCNPVSCLYGIPTDHCRELTINLESTATIVNDNLDEIQIFLRSDLSSPPFTIPLNYSYDISNFTDRVDLVNDLIALGHNVELVDLGGGVYDLKFYNTPYDVALVGFGELDPQAVCSEVYKDIFATHWVTYKADGTIQNIELSSGTVGVGFPAGTLPVKPKDNNAVLADILAKLSAACPEAINVNVCNQLDLTTIEGSLANILTQVTAIEGNTDTVETSLSSIITEIQSGNVNTAQILLDLDAVITELQAIDVNTDGLETQLTSLQATIITEGNETQAELVLIKGILQSIIDKLNAPCGSAQKVEVCPATTVNLVPTHSTATAAGSTTAGVQSVTICNAGNTAGTLGGSTLFPGQCITYTAYVDPVTNVFNRVGAIAYDATGTTFTISELA